MTRPSRPAHRRVAIVPGMYSTSINSLDPTRSRGLDDVTAAIPTPPDPPAPRRRLVTPRRSTSRPARGVTRSIARRVEHGARRRRARALVAGVATAVAAAGGALVVPTTAAAAGPLSVVTEYPVIETQPGTTVQLDLVVDAPTPQTVELEVEGLPDGWTSTLRGGGFVVGAVTAGLEEPSEVSLEIRVPADAPAGEEAITIVGTDAAGTSVRQEVRIIVDANVDTGIGVTADFPSLRGDPTSTFTYTLTVTNNTPAAQTFTFAPSAPQGWTATASPSAQSQANTVTVDPDDTTNVQVAVNPPASAPEGAYDITVDVTSASGLSGTIGLVAEVTGTPTLQFSTADERLDVRGGAAEEQSMQFVVANTGTAALQDVKFAASPPSGWTVTFEPSTLAEVKPNETAQVVATVRPAEDAVVGDYAIEVRASAGSDAANVDLRYSVTRSNWLGVVAVVLILVAVGGLFAVFRRFGRR